MIRGAPRRRTGARGRAALWLALLVVVWLGSVIVKWMLVQWLDRFQPWSGIVLFALVGGTMFVCFVGIELTRRRRIGILPGRDDDD